MSRTSWARRPGSAFAVVSICLALTLSLAACRSRVNGSPGTHVTAQDTLQGRLPVDREEQAFTFEGVESSLLDFRLQADRGNVSAPRVALFDPEGLPVPIDVGRTTPEGAATMKVQGIVLTKTGTYKLRVTPGVPGEAVYYRFDHHLRHPAVTPRTVRLSSRETHPIAVSAPRNALIAVHLTPSHGGVRPQIEGVEDPWGGRALEPALVPAGALPPRVSHGPDRTLTLTFTAATPGVYTILAGAEQGGEGPALVKVEVRPPRRRGSVVLHPDAEPGGYGLPGTPAMGHETPAPPASPPPPDPSLAHVWPPAR